jgi:predicted esterase
MNATPGLQNLPCAKPFLVGIRSFAFAAIALLLVTAHAVAKETKPPEVDSPAKVKPGGTALVTARGKGMRYFLRVPKKYNPRYGARLIVFLHGSNTNGLAYLRSFEAKKWCEHDILCCPNGENGTDPFGQNNFGFKSGPLVADVTEEVQKTFKTPITYIGGHSQGAFLTYNVILNHPDLYRGAFPMAGDCWMQNEPNLWEDKPDVLKKQQQIAIAVIHGKADPVVKFSQGEHAYDCFRAMGWTRLRLFAPAELNHMFMRAPIGEAIEWLDAMNGLNEKRTLALAAQWAKAGEWSWVWHAASASKARGPAIRKLAEAAAEKAAPAIETELEGKPADWIPKWVEFWRVHGESDAAKSLVENYLKERDQQRAAAATLFNQSQALFRSDKRDEAYQTLEQLRDEGPFTYQAYFAVKWLAEKK